MNLRCVEFALKHITCYSKLWKTHALVNLPKGQFTPTLQQSTYYLSDLQLVFLLCWEGIKTDLLNFILSTHSKHTPHSTFYLSPLCLLC